MPKSKKPENPNDGRRFNQPPVEHQIRKGEIRNPHGAAGKPKTESKPLSSFESIYLSEAERIVSRDEKGDVTVERRLIQDEHHDALVKRDQHVRGRLLSGLAAARAKEDQQWAEFEEWFWDCKARYIDEFHLAEKTGRPPPDVCHPDHVELVNRQLIVTGPMERRHREAWEDLKFAIKLCAGMQRQARKAVRDNPTEENRLDLKELDAWRRQLMRRVPKGWNWKEDIYVRDPERKVRRQILADLAD